MAASLARLRRPARAVIAAALAVAGLGTAIPSAQAATLYVDKTGAGGPCSDARTPAQNTIGTPWCTLTRGLVAAPDGSVIAVRRGAYPKLTLRDVSRSTFVRVSPYGTELPTIAGMQLEHVGRLRFERLRFTAGVDIRTASDLQFVGNEVSARLAGPATESGFTVSALKRGVFVGNWVHDTFNGLTIVNRTPTPNSDLTIWGNRLQNLGNDGVGVNSGSSRILIARNDIENVKPRADMDPATHADGVQALAPISTLVLWGNRVFGGGRGFLLMVSNRFWETVGAGMTDVLVSNNLFYGSRDFAIRSFSTPGARIVNNTAWQDGNGGIDLRRRMGSVNASSTGMTLVNNITRNLYVEAGTSFAYRGDNLMVKGPLSGSGDRLGTPLFENAAAGDFRLEPTSPGIDAADPTRAPLLDRNGRGRTDRADLGAVERTSVAVADPFASLPPEVASLVTSSGAAADVQRLLAAGG